MTVRYVRPFFLSCLMAMANMAVVAMELPQQTESPSVPADSRDNTTTSSSAITLPVGFYLEDATPGQSFSLPVSMAFTVDGRILVAEQRGRVHVVDNGVILPTPFINIEAEVLHHWDRGLLGIALDPQFSSNGYVYLLYTFDRDGSGDYQRQDAAARLTRYTVSSANPNVADLSSRLVLIGATFAEAIPSCFYSHTIGTLQFGTDGSLLVGAGDGADFTRLDPGGLHPDCFGIGKFPAAEDVGAFRSQYLGSLAGKILRVDPASGLGLPSNPFYTGNPADNASRVWTLGLRNPFRFTVRANGSTDPTDADPGTLYIGDVGWRTWEDLNVAKSGGVNFGWPCYEGPNSEPEYQVASPAHSDCSTVAGQTAPQFYWHHSNSSQSSPSGLVGRAIVVGDFYPGFRYPLEYRDRIFYADYSRNWVASATADASDNVSDHQQFASNAGNVVEIRYDPVSGLLHWIDIGSGKVMRLRHVDDTPLRVEISSLSATVLDRRVHLTWSTEFEEDNLGFGIEHRSPGQTSYAELGFVYGSKISARARDYSFRTEELDPGLHTFRLRQVNLDGAVAYSSQVEAVVVVGRRLVAEAVYPNPFSDVAHIRFGVGSTQHVAVTLHDVLGRQRAILMDGVMPADNFKVLTIDGSDLESGAYVVRISGEHFVVERRVVVLK